jgi:hypothetical protein
MNHRPRVRCSRKIVATDRRRNSTTTNPKKSRPKRNLLAPPNVLPRKGDDSAGPLAQVEKTALATTNTDSDRGDRFQPVELSSMAYSMLAIKSFPQQEQWKSVGQANFSLLEEMQAQDPLERLVLSQLLLAHGRAVWLTNEMRTQSKVEMIPALSEAAERASGTVARLQRVFSEYRERLAAIKTKKENADFRERYAGQKNAENQPRRTVSNPTLPAQPKRPQLPPSHHSTQSAMDKEYGAADTGGEASSGHECPQARVEVRRDRGL